MDRGRGGRLGREKSVGGGHEPVGSKAFCLLRALPYAQWQGSEVIREGTFTSVPSPSSFEMSY